MIQLQLPKKYKISMSIKQIYVFGQIIVFFQFKFDNKFSGYFKKGNSTKIIMKISLNC